MTQKERERPVLVAEALGKSYEGIPILSGISFTLPPRSVVTFVGENGAGKSTLFNILSGITRPDQGSMILHGSRYQPRSCLDAWGHGVSRVFQEQSLILNVPVYENMVLGQEARFTRAGFVNRAAMIRVAGRMVEDAGLTIDVRRQTGSFDFSKRQSIEIVRACLGPVHVGGIVQPLVLLDEPTSALDRRDEDAFFALVERLRQTGSLLFVSHRLTEVLAVSDAVHVLRDGVIVASLPAKDATEPLLHELMVGRERSADYYHEGRQRDVAAERVVFKASALSAPGLYEAIDLEVRAGEVLGIGGLLDSGKSALGKGVAGVDAPASGRVSLLGAPPRPPRIRKFVRSGLGYVPAERLVDGMITAFSVAWNMSIGSGGDRATNRLGLWRGRQETRTAAMFIDRLRIRSATPRKVCSRLSGGNQQKVVLARWLARNPGVLVLDNPTRGVDAGAKEEIYRVIRELTDGGVGILLITDELLELIGLSNRIIIMQRGRIVAELDAPPDAKPTERELVAWMLPQGKDTGGSAPVKGAQGQSASHQIEELVA
jgi:ribose transport system ATP-binding protein